MTTAITVEYEMHFQRRGKGSRHCMVDGTAPEPPMLKPGRVPRVARLMALALRFQDLLKQGVVPDYAAIARLGHVSRARVTQIMNLIQLAPDLQEELLFLPPTLAGRDRLKLADLQPICQAIDWKAQRRLWGNLCK